MRQGPEKAELCRVLWSWLLGCWITRAWVTEQTARTRARSPCSTLTSRGGSSLLPLSKCKLQWLALSAHSLAQRKHLPISRQKRSEFPNPNAGGTFHSTIFQLAPLQGEMLHQNKSSPLILADGKETWRRPRRRMPWLPRCTWVEQQEKENVLEVPSSCFHGQRNWSLRGKWPRSHHVSLLLATTNDLK